MKLQNCVLAFGILFFQVSLVRGEAGSIIILNGSSSSGKSSIVLELQKTNPQLAVVSVDDVMIEVMRDFLASYDYDATAVVISALDKQIFLHIFDFLNDKKRLTMLEGLDVVQRDQVQAAAIKIKRVCKKHLISSMSRLWDKAKSLINKRACAYAMQGQDVVIDCVVFERDHWKKIIRDCSGLKVYLCTVWAPRSIIKQREIARANREHGTTQLIYDLVYAHDCADLKLDVSDCTPQQAAEQVERYVETHKQPNGLQTLNKKLKTIGLRARYASLTAVLYVQMAQRIIGYKINGAL
jgi:chloramphenicol 3-O-phosphotransferase